MISFPGYKSYSRKDLRNFGVVMGAFFAIVACLSFRSHGYEFTGRAPIWSGVSGVFFVLGLAVPAVLRPLNHVWMLFGAVMGFVMSHVVLAVMFFGVMTPLGLLLRLFGKDLIDMRIDRRKTYWHDRKPAPPEHLYRQFSLAEFDEHPGT